ncbi:MAG: substrate-binding domain-containing protein [Spirochaetales bacterium]|nr:substrate-binding domain-containing protein [Spirochaetales bacterium]
MKFPIKLLLAVFSLLFLFFLLLSLKAISDFTLSEGGGESIPEYSYAFFLPALDYPYFNSLKQGALDGAEDYNSIITFYEIDTDPLSLQMAPYCGADGVALYPTTDELISGECLECLAGSDIPILFLEHNVTHSSAYFVGTNSFEVGKRIGELVRSRDTRAVSCALIFSEKSPGLLADRDLVEMGFRQIMGEKLPEKLIFRVTDRNPLDAEGLVYRLLQEKPDLDTMVFTDSNDTLAAVQVLVDQNLVGKVEVIGFGEDRAIVDYIGKGVIRGTVVRDPYRIGYQAVEVLRGISDRGNASAYVDVGTRLISQVNVGRLEERGDYEK